MVQLLPFVRQCTVTVGRSTAAPTATAAASGDALLVLGREVRLPQGFAVAPGPLALARPWDAAAAAADGDAEMKTALVATPPPQRPATTTAAAAAAAAPASKAAAPTDAPAVHALSCTFCGLGLVRPPRMSIWAGAATV